MVIAYFNLKYEFFYKIKTFATIHRFELKESTKKGFELLFDSMEKKHS